MIGCRYNAKNTLDKNYLYFAEQNGAQVIAEAKVSDIRPVTGEARYEIHYRRSTSPFGKQTSVKARNVIVSAGAIGTLSLLFRCREITHSLPQISPRLGDQARTNNENILGSTARGHQVDYSKGTPPMLRRSTTGPPPLL